MPQLQKLIYSTYHFLRSSKFWVSSKNDHYWEQHIHRFQRIPFSSNNHRMYHLIDSLINLDFTSSLRFQISFYCLCDYRCLEVTVIDNSKHYFFKAYVQLLGLISLKIYFNLSLYDRGHQL